MNGMLEDEPPAASQQIRKKAAQGSDQPRQKKADLRASPGKEGTNDGRLVNITPVNLNNKSLAKSAKSTNSITSAHSSLGRKTDEFVKQRDYYRALALQRKMKVTTEDRHIHALAMLISLNLDFTLFNISVKQQLLTDIQAIISSPMFDSSPLYQKYNLDIVMRIITNPEPTNNKSKKELIEISKVVVQAVTNKYLQRIEDISSGALNDLCKILGVFVSRNGMPSYYKKLLIAELQDKLNTDHGTKNTFVNMHALSHLSFYYGDFLRNVANQSDEKIIPPFYLDSSFSIDTRRALLSEKHKEFPNPGNKLRRVCGQKGWCGSGAKCQVDLWPAADTVKCPKCHQNVHPQCAIYHQALYHCAVCKPLQSRRHWIQRKRTYMVLPHIDDQEIVIPVETTTANETQGATNITPQVASTSQQQTSPNTATQVTETVQHIAQNVTPGTGTNNDTSAMIVDKGSEVNATDPNEDEELQDAVSADELLRQQLGLPAKITPDIPSVTADDNDLEYDSRWDLVFTRPSEAAESDELTLLSMFTSFINALQLTDDSAIVIPWYNSSQEGKINIENMLPDIEAIQIYFPRARINPDNVKVYTDVRIAHSIPRDALEIGIRNYLINTKASLYYKKLQVENTRVVGWFMWSHRFIKADRLAHILAAEHNIHGFLRFSTIYLGKGEKFGPKEGTKALFLVCEAKEFVEISAELRVLYHQGATKFPMGIRLRFMPQIQNIDENLLLKMQIFRVQQFDFNEHIKTAGTADIQLLDASINGEKTLRNFIMNLTHTTSKDPLFLSVDTQWNDPSRCVFSFIVSHDKEAIRMVNTLAAHVLKKNPERAKFCFTPKALEAAATFIWDEANQCFMTAEESYFMEMEVWGKDTALMGVSQASVEIKIASGTNANIDMTEQPASRIERIYSKRDACSVGTVASKFHTKKITGDIGSDTDARSLGGDSISTTATSRSRTTAMDKRLVVMEANINHTNQTIVDMGVMLANIAKQLQAKDLISTPAATGRVQIQDSSAGSNNAPDTGDLADSGRSLTVGEAGGGTSTATTPNIVASVPVHTTTRFRQTRLDNRRFNNNEHWGDNILRAPVNSVRIGFRNIKFLPASATNDRNAALCTDIKLGHIDVLGVSEVNLAWQHIDYNSQPQSRFRKHFEQSKWICANNRTDLGGVVSQRGGTMLGTFNATSNRVVEMGTDFRNLGRWCWSLFQGKETKLLICTVYRSCGTRGATTSYSQQKRTLMLAGITTCPRSQFWDDIKTSISTWDSQGYHIVVGGDFNEYVGDTRITSFFEEFGMREAIRHKWGTPSPNTYEDGTVPIDGIFCTRSLEIKAAGYTSLFFGIQTDHRLLWMDVSMESAFGVDSNLFQQASARKLQLDQPNVVDQYIGQRLYLMTKNQLRERTIALHTKVLNGARGLSIIMELEKLDRLRTSDMLTAEHRCRKIKAGNVAWSPTLQKSIEILRYLRLVISRHRNGSRINSRTLMNAFLNSKMATAVFTLESAIELLIAEKVAYKTVKYNADEQRKSFLESLAEDKASASGMETSTILKQLKLREQQRSLARQLHRIKGFTKRGLHELEVMKDGHWVTVTDKFAIEQECMTEGKQRFEQANTTACLTSDQIELLGWTADTADATQLLKGIIPNDLHSDIKHIASYLCQPSTVTERSSIDSLMTEEQYVRGWTKAKERTSSGTSGLHFGHFKANISCQETLDIDILLLQISIMLGYSLIRWKSAVDVMIPKKADSKRASQLRVICLMEPDFNFMNKWMGKITMANAEAAVSIAPEQFGSRKHKSAIQHAFNKALCFDTLRTMKDDAALTVLDAKSCYDRIPPPLACLCLRRQGLPQNIIDASFNSIKDMTHHIRTAYGISNVSYERDDDSYMHGILQGNGAGPCIWVMLSSPILDMLADQGNGAILNLPDGQTIKVVAFAFVDDIDLIQKLPQVNPLSALQHDFNLWEKGLQTISGALVWEKCDVYVLQHIWDDRLHNWKLADKDFCPGSINVIHEGQHKAITRKEPNEATLSLGVMFAPSGDMKDQVIHLRAKSETWADLLRTKRISPEAVWYSLTASIMKTIEYPLLATTMSQQELTTIMAPILLSALPRAKICRYISRDVLYSLPMHHGMGLQNPYYTQGVRKLMEVMHAECPKNSSYLFIKAANLAMELYTGLGPRYLTFPMTKLILKTVPNSILRGLWEFLSEYKIQLESLTDEKRQFPNDAYIMSHIYSSQLKPKEVSTFNYCRHYLQLEQISDIITTDGKRIQQHVWNGMLLLHRLDERQWPNQPRPTGTAWTTFRKILRHIFHTNEDGVLQHQLIVEGWQRRHWKWFFCSATGRLFEATTNRLATVRGLAIDRNRRTRQRSNRFRKHSTAFDTIPNEAIPVTVFENYGLLQMELSTATPTPGTPYVKHLRWSDFLQVQRNMDTTSLDFELRQGNLILVSDGSYKDNVGSAAWVLASTKTKETFVTGQCATTGPPHAQDSHRSELFGILGGLFFLKTYLKKFQPTQRYQLQVGLDNMSAMNYVFDHQRYPIVKSFYPDFDVIAAARSLLNKSVDYATVHIAGHQDDNFVGPLDFLPTLNVRMDDDCKRFRGKVQVDLSKAIVPNQQYILKFQDHVVCKKVDATLREGISATTMGMYWDRHDEIELSKFPTVAWHSMGHSMKNETALKQHWVVKHSTGICGVNEKLVQWKEKTSAFCVRCGKIENAAHVWKCKHHSSQVIWDKSLLELKDWMIDQSAAPSIINALIQGLKNWYDDMPSAPGCPLSMAQQSIGWQHIITGKFHVIWIDEQQHHFFKIGRGKKSSLRWLSKLISRIWKIAWALWEVRNEYEHEDDIQKRNLIYTSRIEQELAEGFMELHESCQYFFSEREVTHLRTTATVEYKRHWLDLVSAARFVITSASIPIPTLPLAPLPI